MNLTSFSGLSNEFTILGLNDEVAVKLPELLMDTAYGHTEESRISKGSGLSHVPDEIKGVGSASVTHPSV